MLDKRIGKITTGSGPIRSIQTATPILETRHGCRHARIRIRAIPDRGFTHLVIRVTDSGPGFDFSDYLRQGESGTAHSGRGIRMVRSLCESVRYRDPGNRVEVVHAWQHG